APALSHRAVARATASAPPIAAAPGVQRPTANRPTSQAAPMPPAEAAIRTAMAPPKPGPATTVAAARPKPTAGRMPGGVAASTAPAAHQAEAAAVVDPLQPAPPRTAWLPASAPSDDEPHRTSTEAIARATPAPAT